MNDDRQQSRSEEPEEVAVAESRLDDSQAVDERFSRKSAGMGHVIGEALHGETVSKEGVLEALGGVRGMIESILPGLLFLLWFAFTQDALTALIAPVVVAVALLVVRLARHEKVMPALTGLFAVAVCAAATLITGDGRDYYAPGLIINAVWIVGITLSLIVRWPVVGLIGGAILGNLTQWREWSAYRRASFWLTVMWLGLFVLRLAVQWPLYLVGEIEALGIARLAMGIPPYALLIVITWRVLATAGKAPLSSSDE
ncbi:MAG: DUF3159 domain-containing protein [Canibacter sp.]